MKKISLATILSILFMFSSVLYAGGTLEFTIKPEPSMASMGGRAFRLRAVVCGTATLGISGGLSNVWLDSKIPPIKLNTLTEPLIDAAPVCSVWVTNNTGSFFYHRDTNPVTIRAGFPNYYFTVNVGVDGANLVFDGNWK